MKNVPHTCSSHMDTLFEDMQCRPFQTPHTNTHLGLRASPSTLPECIIIYIVVAIYPSAASWIESVVVHLCMCLHVCSPAEETQLSSLHFRRNRWILATLPTSQHRSALKLFPTYFIQAQRNDGAAASAGRSALTCVSKRVPACTEAPDPPTSQPTCQLSAHAKTICRKSKLVSACHAGVKFPSSDAQPAWTHATHVCFRYVFYSQITIMWNILSTRLVCAWLQVSETQNTMRAEGMKAPDSIND